MPANRDENGRFVAGNNANPTGRPKVPREVREAIRAACPEAVQVLIELLHDKKSLIRLEAAKSLLDRGYGKPETMSKIELTGSNDGALVFRWATDEKGGNVEARSEDFQT